MPFSFPSKICALTGEAFSPLPMSLQIETLLKAGVRFIQVRSVMNDAELLPVLSASVALCRMKNATLILQGPLNLARDAQLHGVHLDGSTEQVAQARSELGARFVIGLTVRNVVEWQAAQASGADYLLLEPIFPSANSPDQPPAHGVSGLNRLAARGGLPLAAHGAISRDTLPIVLAAGAGTALVGRAIWKEKNPEAAARALLKLAGEGLALPVAQIPD